MKEQLLLWGKALVSLWTSQFIYDVGLFEAASIYVTRKGSLSLFRVQVLTLSAGCKSGSEAGMWDLNPLETILSSLCLLIFSSVLEMTIVEDLSLPLLLAAAPLALTSAPPPPKKWHQAERARYWLVPLFPPKTNFPETHREFLLSSTDDQNCSRTTEIDLGLIAELTIYGKGKGRRAE